MLRYARNDKFYVSETKMCGRKTITRDMLSIIEELAIDEWQDPDSYFPSYNVAPTQVTPILVYNGKRIVTPMRWGLIPNWAKDEKMASRMINARAETIMEKPSFKNLMHRNRCVVIADGYYEWKKTETERQPYYIHHPNGKLLPMAGLWDQWRNPEGKPVLSYTVITTTPQSELAHIHNRMPVILTRDNIETWIDWKQNTVKAALPLLTQRESALTAYPVSLFVNSPKNNSPDCILSII